MILVDTHVLVAVANSRDNNHLAAHDMLETSPDDLLVARTVIAEVCYLLSERAGPTAEVQFLRAFGAGELHLVELTLADVERMAELAERYADLASAGPTPPWSPSPSAWVSTRSRPLTAGTSAWCDPDTSTLSRFCRSETA